MSRQSGQSLAVSEAVLTRDCWLAVRARWLPCGCVSHCPAGQPGLAWAQKWKVPEQRAGEYWCGNTLQASGCVLVYKCPKAKAGSGRPADSRGEDADSAFFFFFNLFYYLFIFSRAGSSLLHRLFSVASGAPLESRCSGLSLQRLLLQSTGPGACRLQWLRCMRSAVASGLQSTSSTVVLHGLSCSMACAISIEPGMELMSPALAGRVLSTEPPGSPNSAFWREA